MESKDIKTELLNWLHDNGYLNSKGKDFLIQRLKEE